MMDVMSPPGRNVVDFAGYCERRHPKAKPLRPPCRHCGAALGDGESDDDCSSAGLAAAVPARPRPRRTFRAE